MSKILTPKEYKKMYKEIQKQSDEMLFNHSAGEVIEENKNVINKENGLQPLIDTIVEIQKNRKDTEEKHTGIQEFALKYPEWYKENKRCIWIENSHISLVIPNYKRLEFKLQDEKRDSEDVSYYIHNEALALENDTYRLPTKKDHKALVRWISDGTMGSDFLQMVLGYGLNGYRDRIKLYRECNGHYWSSSPSAANASDMVFHPTGVNPAGIAFRSLGFSVRCLLK